MSEPTEFYYNTKTGEVEFGKQSSWLHRMGPYASYDDAEHAMELAAERNRESDAEDEEWEGEWAAERDVNQDGEPDLPPART
ncbi:hypothetical protein [Changpingibacter yushuensis]|uniref:hypothetical protein n=1 Tax=Changpingibacter yushuensis TaxID=2758440 RepID=UPI0015F7112D|nr:hypothetical protein [Changpingibacter yushuensis]